MINAKHVVILAALAFLILSFSTVQAGIAKFDRYEWSMRLDTTKSPYACSAAPGGRVTGAHINFYISTKDRASTLFNLHIWLNYLPKIYVSEGGWCKKIDNKTWKKLFEEIRDRLKSKMPTKAIDKLIKSLDDVPIRFIPVMVLPPDCKKPKDPYSIIMCKMLCLNQNSNKNNYCAPNAIDIAKGGFTIEIA